MVQFLAHAACLPYRRKKVATINEHQRRDIMITVLASIRVETDQTEKFLKLFKANVPNVLEEDGCIEYYPTIDIDSGLEIQDIDPSVVTIVECWDSMEALKRHLASPHMLQYREAVQNLVKEVRLKILQSV